MQHLFLTSKLIFFRTFWDQLNPFRRPIIRLASLESDKIPALFASSMELLLNLHKPVFSSTKWRLTTSLSYKD